LQRGARQAAFFADLRLLDLKARVLGLGGQLDEIDHGGAQHGMRHTRAADLVRRDDTARPRARQLLLGAGFLDAGHNEEIFIEEPRAHGDVKVVRIGSGDRDERPGVKVMDADLVGIPVRLTIGDKALAENADWVLIHRDRPLEVPHGK